MRKSGGLLIPLTLILMYYAFLIVSMMLVIRRWPGFVEYLPVGGVEDLPGTSDNFEPVYSSVQERIYSSEGPIRLLISSLGAVLLAVPVSWAYFITSRVRRIDQSFLQTIMILPVVVAGISMIVLNSLALAFSLAGRRGCGSEISFYLATTVRCDVHICGNRDWIRLRYRCPGDCDRYLVCFRCDDASYLETGIR